MSALNRVAVFLQKHMAISIFLVLFVIYNLNCRPIGSIDTVPASLLPFAILDQHSLYLDQFIAYLTEVWYPNLGFLYPNDSHYLSIYPIIIPLAITPLYVIPYLLLKLMHVPIDMYDPIFRLAVMGMEKLCASLIAAISGVLIYLALKRLVSERTAIISALIFGLATSVFSTSSQGLWQQGMSGLLLSLMIYIIVSAGQEGPGWFRCTALGVLSALFFFNRSSDAMLILPIALYILTLKDRRILYYGIAGILLALPFFTYGMYFFGNPIGGFNRMSYMLSLSNLPGGVAGLLFSPSRGLLVYSPVVLLAIPGILKIRDLASQRLKWFLYAAGLGILLTILLYGSFSDWHGGTCYGTRYMTAIMPFIAIYIGLCLDSWRQLSNAGHLKTLAMAFVLALVLYSIFIQFVGVFCYPNGGYNWDLSRMGRGDEKYWDWQNSQIVGCLQAGFWNPLNILGHTGNK